MSVEGSAALSNAAGKLAVVYQVPTRRFRINRGVNIPVGPAAAPPADPYR